MRDDSQNRQGQRGHDCTGSTKVLQGKTGCEGHSIPMDRPDVQATDTRPRSGLGVRDIARLVEIQNSPILRHDTPHFVA